MLIELEKMMMINEETKTKEKTKETKDLLDRYIDIDVSDIHPLIRQLIKWASHYSQLYLGRDL